jgi:hypothetical protein
MHPGAARSLPCSLDAEDVHDEICRIWWLPRDVWTVDRAVRQGRADREDGWLRAPISERTGRHVPAPTTPKNVGASPLGLAARRLT